MYACIGKSVNSSAPRSIEDALTVRVRQTFDLCRSENGVAERSVDRAMERRAVGRRKPRVLGDELDVLRLLVKHHGHLAAHLRGVKAPFANARLAGQRDHEGLVELIRPDFEVHLFVCLEKVEESVHGPGVFDEVRKRLLRRRLWLLGIRRSVSFLRLCGGLLLLGVGRGCLARTDFVANLPQT